MPFSGVSSLNSGRSRSGLFFFRPWEQTDRFKLQLVAYRPLVRTICFKMPGAVKPFRPERCARQMISATGSYRFFGKSPLSCIQPCIAAPYRDQSIVPIACLYKVLLLSQTDSPPVTGHDLGNPNKKTPQPFTAAGTKKFNKGGNATWLRVSLYIRQTNIPLMNQYISNM
jgi:hypothetical protein